jgi:hypothetical protein
MDFSCACARAENGNEAEKSTATSVAKIALRFGTTVLQQVAGIDDASASRMLAMVAAAQGTVVPG